MPSATCPRTAASIVLLADDHGNHLVRTDYGITGWAQKGEKLEAGSEAFPALETLTETFNGDTLATIHYNPQLGKKQDSYYHYDANNKAVAGKAPADAGDGAFDYHFLLETALKPGGTAYNLAYADIGANDLSYLSLSQKSDALPAYDSTQGLPTDLTIPGNGYLYSYDDDASTHYFPVREKWRIKENGDKEAAAQPFYYLGLDSTYHSQWHEDGDKPAENRAVPAKLLDRIDGSKAIAEIAPEGKVTLILGKQTLCGYDNAPADCDDSASGCSSKPPTAKAAGSKWITARTTRRTWKASTALPGKPITRRAVRRSRNRPHPSGQMMPHRIKQQRLRALFLHSS